MAATSKTIRCDCCASVPVFTRKKDAASNVWQGVPAGSAMGFADVVKGLNEKEETMTIIIGKADVMRGCHRCRTILETDLKLPVFWWSTAARRANGYFGCDASYDASGKIESYITWSRFILKIMIKNPKLGQKDYGWVKLNVFSRWLASGHSLTIIFDPKNKSKLDHLVRDIPSPLFDGAIAWSDPFWIHAQLVQKLVELQDESVWGVRDRVRETEETRAVLPRRDSLEDKLPEPNFESFHEIGRHAIHVSETLELAVKTVDGLVRHHEAFWNDSPGSTLTGHARLPVEAKKVRDRLDFYGQMLRALKFRNDSNKERLSNEIQLAYNTVAQYDSRISVRIGKAAQTDAAAMKTLAFLTLAFLPATFICAVFSMSFFNYDPPNGDDPGGWFVSDKFYIYWVVTIPVTICTVSLCWWKFVPKEATKERVEHFKEMEHRGREKLMNGRGTV